ncbi:DUF2167 domain-containing protein [Flavobacterium sp. LM5]|jgi:uncharacterized membrane-anchored protein|uniref:DUF2167 domain-containing protein n=1 Tax=Flavobacterium sp. LM5 TaxID=1938610 RepID=UPI0009948659|nr:DUF2167 domain-containing protein [Flavobacterium sp. LM5]
MNLLLKRSMFIVMLYCYSILSFAQDNSAQKIDSIEQTFTYERGSITLKNGIGTITVPKGFKYLNAEQAERVLVDLWGNPKTENITLGLLLPENQGVLSQKGYVFNIQYDEIGYVEDKDADDIDYDELLTQIKEDTKEENIERKKEGYEPITIVGWASTPFYDKEKKILHWAKEIKFGSEVQNTLNYNIRILGRKGVLVLNAIAGTSELPLVQKDINKVIDIVSFNKGYTYAEFDSSIDNVAAWTIGGLVAGKVLTKVGFFAILAKFGKIIVITLIGLFGAFKNKIMNLFSKKENDVAITAENEVVETTTEQQ